MNISLNIWLEGNKTAKANASVKVKLSIVCETRIINPGQNYLPGVKTAFRRRRS